MRFNRLSEEQSEALYAVCVRVVTNRYVCIWRRFKIMQRI